MRYIAPKAARMSAQCTEIIMTQCHNCWCLCIILILVPLYNLSVRRFYDGPHGMSILSICCVVCKIGAKQIYVMYTLSADKIGVLSRAYIVLYVVL